MSNKPMPWIKQYPALLRNDKFCSLSDRAKLRYLQMYLLAGDLNAEGLFIQDGDVLSVAGIARQLGASDLKQFEKDLAELKRSKLIRVNGHGPYISKFKDEQLNWVEKQNADRERKQLQRSRENVTRDTTVTDEQSRDGHTPRTRPKNQNQEPEPDSDSEPTTPTPPSKRGRSSRAGGLVSKNKTSFLDGPEFKGLNKNQRAVMSRIEHVLSLSGLGNLKLKNTLNLLTTRSSPKNKIQFVLAALASAYADKNANNKAIIATHRMEKSTVPAQYFSPTTWDVIPEEIINAAGDVGIDTRTPASRTRAMIEAARKRSAA